MKNRLGMSDKKVDQFDSGIYKKIEKEFGFRGDKRDIIDHFTQGGCFEFAYFYKMLKDPESKIKLLMGIDYRVTYDDIKDEFGVDKRKIESFDLGHAYIETSDGRFLDIHGYIGEREIEGFKKNMEGNDFGDIVVIDYGSKFKNYNIDENFIIGLEPYGDKYITFSSALSGEEGKRDLLEKWKKVWGGLNIYKK